MAYAFQPNEEMADAVQRIISELIDRAVGHLSSTDVAEKRVHNARKRFKEIRAVLRLVRKPLRDQFAIENRWYRDIGRDLAAARDAEAAVETVEALLKIDPEHATLRRVHAAMVKRKGEVHAHDLEDRIAGALQQLPLAKARLIDWPPLRDRFATIGRGLERTFREAIAGFRLASADPTPEHLHEWRKRVKDHWYHVQLLRPVWPEMMKPYGAVLEQLSGALGAHHDLAVLRTVTGDDPEMKEIIDGRARELEEAAFALGQRIYAEDPAVFRGRIRTWWHGWRESSRD